MTLIPVILSGGAGTRLWPVSRDSHPKPFIKLAVEEKAARIRFFLCAMHKPQQLQATITALAELL